MKKFFLLLVMSLVGIGAQAADRNAAAAICKSMSFDTEKNACISAIGKHDYFDEAAIKVCKGLSFDSEKLTCVRAIGGKNYDAYEIEHCNSLSFDSEIAACMQNAGRRPPFNPVPPSGCLTSGQIIYELQHVDRLIFERKNQQARYAVQNLMRELQHCP